VKIEIGSGSIRSIKKQTIIFSLQRMVFVNLVLNHQNNNNKVVTEYQAFAKLTIKNRARKLIGEG
jgi:hypothetical protein